MRRHLRIRPRFWCFIIALTIGIFLAGYAVTQASIARGAERYAALREEYRTLAAEVETLENDIAFAQTDEYVERVARSELGLIRPGEIRYVNGGY